MVRFIFLVLILSLPVSGFDNSEDDLFFPMGAWAIFGGGVGTSVNDDGLVLSKSGINFLVGQYDFDQQQVYWFDASKNWNLKLNVKYSPAPLLEHPWAYDRFYTNLYRLPESYPVQRDEDSLAFWWHLKESLVDTMRTDYQDENYPVYSSFATYYDGLTQQVRVKKFPGIDSVCQAAQKNGPGNKSFCYGYGSDLMSYLMPQPSINTNVPFDSVFRVSHQPWDPDYNIWLQKVMWDKLDTTCHFHCSSYPQTEYWAELNTAWNPDTASQAPWPEQRYPTETELRAESFISLAYGAKGFTYWPYRAHPTNMVQKGLVDSIGQPYMHNDLKDSIFGEGSGVTVNEGEYTIFSDFWHVACDLRNLGPAFRKIKLDAIARAENEWSKPFWVGEVGTRCKVESLNWYQRTPDIWQDSLHAEIGVFNGDVDDPNPENNPQLRRDYVNVVNRNCRSYQNCEDSVKLAIFFDKTGFQESWWVVDMRCYMYSSLKDADPYWRIDHNGWTHYQEHRDWGPLPAVKPGEGKLYAIVDDPYLWNILGGIFCVAINKYETMQHYMISFWARGELFKNGPRRRDVGFVKIDVFKLLMPPTLPDSTRYPKSLVSPPQRVKFTKIKPEATVNSVGNKYLVKSDTILVSRMTFDWGPNSPFFPSGVAPDSCYFGTMDEPLAPGSYEIHIEVYNRLGEYMGCPIFCINGKPSATSKFSKMTAYPCGKKVVDPEGVFHMVYTGGTNIPVVLYAKYNPKDTMQAVPESLYTGTYPTPETLGIGKFPTIVVKHGDTKDIVGVAWLSLLGDTIYYSVKPDSQWFGPYVLDGNQNSNSHSVPRMALGLNDTVYYTYALKPETDPTKIQLICGKFPLLNFTSQLASEVSEWENTGSISDPIDSLGAAIGVDYNGCPHLAWLENDTIVRYGMARFGGFAVITLAKVRYRGGLGEPACIINNFPNANVCVVWPQNNKLIRSCFYVEDTVEIFRDTVRVGEDTIKQISAKDGFVSWKENNHLFVGLWDAVNRTWSPPETLDTDSLEGFYTQTEANQFINSANDISPARYVIWTARINDTLYWLTGSIKKYAGNGEYGIMPAAYLKLGQPQSTPFTVYRDSILSFGNEDYKHVDIGYDSLIYHLPFVRPDDKGRIFIESYFDSGDTTGSCIFRLVVNGRIIKDSIAIYSRQLSRTTEFLPPEVMQAGQLTIKLIKLGGDYVPCSRIILTTFELDLTGRTGGGQQSQKLQTLPKTFILYQNMPNPFSKVTVIRYGLPVKTRVSLKIYDVMGRQVKKLVDGEQQPGFYAVNWDGKDDQNRSLASGVYFYRLETKEYKSTKKVVQLR